MNAVHLSFTFCVVLSDLMECWDGWILTLVEACMVLNTSLVTLSGCCVCDQSSPLSSPDLYLNGFLTCFQRSSFVTLSVQDIFKILLKHLLTNVCSLLWDDFVFLPVSELYHRTLFTLESEILGCILREMAREFHTFFSKLKSFVVFDFGVFVSSSIHTNCASKVYEWWTTGLKRCLFTCF